MQKQHKKQQHTHVFLAGVTHIHTHTYTHGFSKTPIMLHIPFACSCNCMQQHCIRCKHVPLDLLFTLTEPLHQSRCNFMVEALHRFRVGIQDGPQALGCCSTHLPAHVFIITIVLFFTPTVLRSTHVRSTHVRSTHVDQSYMWINHTCGSIIHVDESCMWMNHACGSIMHVDQSCMWINRT